MATRLQDFERWLYSTFRLKLRDLFTLRVPTAIDCSANPNYPASKAGDAYVVSGAGKIGGASGDVVEVGDEIQCLANSAAGTKAQVGSNFLLLNKNLTTSADGALTSNSDALVPTQKAVKSYVDAAQAAAVVAAAADTDTDVGEAVSTAAGDATGKANAARDAAIAAAEVDNAERVGNQASYIKTLNGAQESLLGGNAVPRYVLITVEVTETFADGDGAKPSFDIGETGTANKFKAGLNSGTAGDPPIVIPGVLSANAALLVTATAGTGTTETGAIRVTVLALPSA
jgi:hypothetical protein